MRTAVFIAWAVFGLYWFIAAFGASPGSRNRRAFPPGLIIVVALLLARVFRTNALAVHSRAVQAIGLVLVLAGLSFAVWARIYLGRNWGMPMTRKEDPELVTSGPYRFVRHPIYSGLLLAAAGTALATNLLWLIGLIVMAGYFLYSARIEEELMTASFPAVYPGYRARTKMLVPFLL